MTQRGAPEILRERMDVVLALGVANAAHHRAQARMGGAEIGMMTVAEGADGGGRDAAEDAEATARLALDAAETRVRALDDQLAALDRELAAAVS